MIVRILGEGQFELEDDQIASLEELDQQLVAALEADDEPTFRDVLLRMLHTCDRRERPFRWTVSCRPV